MKKNKSKLSDYLKLFAIYIIESTAGNTKKQIISEINNMTGKYTIDSLPFGILSYLKKIDG